jgi:hypothetical protein
MKTLKHFATGIAEALTIVTLLAMPFLVIVVMVLFIAAAPRAHAQSANPGLTYQGPTTLINGGTNVVAANSTNTYNLRVDVPRADTVTFFASAKPLSSNSIAFTMYLQRSVDGTTWDTYFPYTLNVTGTTNTASTNVVSIVTNIPLGGIPFLKITTGGNTDFNGIMTNLTLKYGFKR